VVVTDECLKETHSELGRKSCDNLSNLNLEMKIQKKRTRGYYDDK